MENILEVSNLKKEYDNFKLNNINFSLERGYIMGFIGPNGAGKSTTIKLIMNLIARDGGDVKIFGVDNIKNEVAVKDRIGFVYDENYYYEELSIEKMKSIVAPFYTRWDERTFNKYIKEFGLNPKTKIKELSKGMKTKFSLAVALSHNAELIVMDEPTSGLDPVFRQEILEILLNIIQDERKSIFFSTHITTDLEKIADYITFIDKGNIVFSKTKDDIMNEYKIVKGGLDVLNDSNKREFIGIKENSFGFEALTNDVEKIKKIFKGDVLFEKPSLEDIMIYSVKQNNNY